MCGLRPRTLPLLPGRECGERRGGTYNSDEDRSRKVAGRGFPGASANYNTRRVYSMIYCKWFRRAGLASAVLSPRGLIESTRYSRSLLSVPSMRSSILFFSRRN